MDFLQRNFSTILPQMSDVLDRVNRQMLLILKTNDLIRGIEHTLKTNKRMGAFRVMSSCCVRSVYGDKLRKSNSNLNRVGIVVAQYWQLFKINIFYSLLSLGNFYNTVRENLMFTMGRSVILKADS